MPGIRGLPIVVPADRMLTGAADAQLQHHRPHRRASALTVTSLFSADRHRIADNAASACHLIGGDSVRCRSRCRQHAVIYPLCRI
jgi:hypothetical protein